MRTINGIWAYLNPQKKKSRIEILESDLSVLVDAVFEDKFKWKDAAYFSRFSDSKTINERIVDLENKMKLLLEKLDLEIKTISEKTKLVSKKNKK
jgi:hypothetical protein